MKKPSQFPERACVIDAVEAPILSAGHWLRPVVCGLGPHDGLDLFSGHIHPLRGPEYVSIGTDYDPFTLSGRPDFQVGRSVTFDKPAAIDGLAIPHPHPHDEGGFVSGYPPRLTAGSADA